MKLHSCEYNQYFFILVRKAIAVYVLSFKMFCQAFSAATFSCCVFVVLSDFSFVFTVLPLKSRLCFRPVNVLDQRGINFFALKFLELFSQYVKGQYDRILKEMQKWGGHFMVLISGFQSCRFTCMVRCYSCFPPRFTHSLILCFTELLYYLFHVESVFFPHSMCTCSLVWLSFESLCLKARLHNFSNSQL